MTKKSVLTALLIVAGALSLEAQKIGGTRIEKGNDLAGVITDSSSGKGIPGVAVSDGYNYTVTDRNGVYQMKAHPRSRTVSYTTPSIPSSGLVHEYTASRIESGYEDL